MNANDYDVLIKKNTDARLKMSKDKRLEYASITDVLNNFKKQGDLICISSEKVLSVYLHKHLSSIDNYISNGCVDKGMTESIIERIHDAQNYLDLLTGLITERENCSLIKKHKKHKKNNKNNSIGYS